MTNEAAEGKQNAQQHQGPQGSNCIVHRLTSQASPPSGRPSGMSLFAAPGSGVPTTSFTPPPLAGEAAFPAQELRHYLFYP